jgi:drug/metabolite transporter (DMT)-like permease
MSVDAPPAAGGHQRLGILCIVAAVSIFAVLDGYAKFLVADVPAVQLVWARFAIQAVIMLAMAAATRRWTAFRPSMPGVQAARGTILVTASMIFVSGLGAVPLATATVIGFAGPLFVVVLSILFLGEKVGWRRMTAVAVGFAGTVLVVRPGTGEVPPEALLILSAAALWSVGFVLTRRLGQRDSVFTTNLWTCGSGALLVTLVVPFFYQPLSAGLWAQLLLLGAVNLGAQFLMVFGATRADASLLAPFMYSQIIVSVLFGWWVFASVPDLWTWVGAAIIVGSGIYVWHRERVRARERREAAA